jgi:hypothetical protein
MRLADKVLMCAPLRASLTCSTPHGWGAYERPIGVEPHDVGKEHTQQIESQHSNLRTRIKTSRTPYNVFFHNSHEVRSGDWPLHQSLRVWGRHLTQDRHLWNTFLSS